MADRTVNVNINYKVNTADVQKAAVAAQSAQKATDNLRKSTAAYGQTGASAGRQAADGLKQTTTAAGQASAATSNLTKQFGDLYGAVKAVATAGVAREIVDVALGMARLSGRVEGVETAFKRVFPNSIATLTKLQKATHGALTDFELMQRTLQATNLGVAVEQLPTLFEFAAARAQQTGESVDYLVDSIVRGIGRKSPLILDNLGISATRLKEKFDGAALASQSVGDVTKVVGEIIQEEMAKSGGYVETAETKVSQLTVAWQKLQVQVAKGSESFNVGLIDFLTQSAQGLRQLVAGNRELFLEEARRIASQDALRVIESKAFKDLKDNQQAKFDLLQQEINSRVQIIGRYNDNIAKLKEERDILKDKNPYDNRIDQLNRNIKGYNDNKVVLAATILALKEYLKTIELTPVAEEKQIRSIKTLRDELSELKKQREEMTFIGNTKELDRLQREILLQEDLILKVSDNIKWQQQWNREKELSALADMNAKEEAEQLKNIIDGLTESYVIAAEKAPDLTDSLKEMEEGMEELAETVKISTSKEFFIRLRLAFQGKGGDASEVQKSVEDAVNEVKMGVLDIAVSQASSLLEVELQSNQARLAAIQDFYSQQQTLAGDNQRAKQELQVKEERETAVLQRKIFDREKSIRKAQALIDGAAAVIKAFVTAPNVYVAIIQAAFIAAQTASQLAIINRQQPRFAKGVIDVKGKGTGTSDSIDAKISRGESIITAQRTQESKGLLHAIQDGKISDKQISQDVLNKLHVTESGVTYNEFDDSRIVNELRKQKPIDYVAHANILWEVRTSADGLHKKLRRKSMGY